MTDNIKIIREECSEILSIYRKAGKVLYRGMKGKPSVFRRTIRTNRVPAATPVELHDATDARLIELGFDARRSNGMFCTACTDTAGIYGDLYVVLPFNGFKFTYWKEAWDFFEFLDDVLDSEGLVTFKEMWAEGEWDDDSIAYLTTNLNQIIDMAGPTSESMLEAINLENEVMISGEGYWAIAVDQWDAMLPELISKSAAKIDVYP